VSEVALADVDRALAEVAPLPRSNGELVFDEPWQGRALGMGILVLERTGTSWADWRPQLARAIAARGFTPGEAPAAAYYEAWLDALESLLRERQLLEPAQPSV
jgi:nitrile hydratase accessory protein